MAVDRIHPEAHMPLNFGSNLKVQQASGATTGRLPTEDDLDRVLPGRPLRPDDGLELPAQDGLPDEEDYRVIITGSRGSARQIG